MYGLENLEFVLARAGDRDRRRGLQAHGGRGLRRVRQGFLPLAEGRPGQGKADVLKEIWAELSDKVDQSTMQRIMEDKSLSDLVIIAPASEVTDLAAHVKMASDNPLRSGRNILSENRNKNKRLEK